MFTKQLFRVNKKVGFEPFDVHHYDIDSDDFLCDQKKKKKIGEEDLAQVLRVQCGLASSHPDSLTHTSEVLNMAFACLLFLCCFDSITLDTSPSFFFYYKNAWHD